MGCGALHYIQNGLETLVLGKFSCGQKYSITNSFFHSISFGAQSVCSLFQYFPTCAFQNFALAYFHYHRAFKS